MLARSLGLDRHAQDVGRPPHDGQELVDRVVVQPAYEAKAVAEGAGDQPGAGSRPYQRESGKVQPDAPGGRALPDQDVELEVLHGRIEDLLHGTVEAMDLVDEQDIALLQVGQQRCQVARPDQHRPCGDAEPHAHLGSHDPGQRSLPQPGGTGEQQVIDRLPALAGRLEHDPEVLGELGLPDELVEGPRPEVRLIDLFGRGGHRVHRADSASRALGPAPAPAASLGPAPAPALSIGPSPVPARVSRRASGLIGCGPVHAGPSATAPPPDRRRAGAPVLPGSHQARSRAR